MKISLSILTRPFGKRRLTSDSLIALNNALRGLRSDAARGTAAIDEFLEWYLRYHGDITLAMTAAGRGDSLRAFSLSELSKHILELTSRKAEGAAVIDEFFALYVLEPA